MKTVSTVPLIPTKSLQETAAQLACKPSCSCGGQGWTGVIDTKDGPLLVKCRHATFTDTDFVLAIKHMDVLNENIKNINESMNKQFDLTINATIDTMKSINVMRSEMENNPAYRIGRWITEIQTRIAQTRSNVTMVLKPRQAEDESDFAIGPDPNAPKGRPYKSLSEKMHEKALQIQENPR